MGRLDLNEASARVAEAERMGKNEIRVTRAWLSQAVQELSAARMAEQHRGEVFGMRGGL